MKYAISQEGADALVELAEKVLCPVSDVLEAGNWLKKSIEGDIPRLGIYGSEIREIAGSSLRAISSSWEDLKELSTLLSDRANAILVLVGGLNNSSFGSEGNSGFVKTKRITPSEQTELYKSGLRDVEDQLYYLRKDLIEQGIPKGEWLDGVINEQSIMMKSNLSGELEIARGGTPPNPLYPDPDISSIVERYYSENNEAVVRND